MSAKIQEPACLTVKICKYSIVLSKVILSNEYGPNICTHCISSVEVMFVYMAALKCMLTSGYGFYVYNINIFGASINFNTVNLYVMTVIFWVMVILQIVSAVSDNIRVDLVQWSVVVNRGQLLAANSAALVGVCYFSVTV